MAAAAAEAEATNERRAGRGRKRRAPEVVEPVAGRVVRRGRRKRLLAGALRVRSGGGGGG